MSSCNVAHFCVSGYTHPQTLQLCTSQQIWQQNKQLAKAQQVTRKAKRCRWDDLTQEEQGLVIAYNDGRLDRSLQNLMSQKASQKHFPYKGVAACVAKLQKGQRWGRG